MNPLSLDWVIGTFMLGTYTVILGKNMAILATNTIISWTYIQSHKPKIKLGTYTFSLETISVILWIYVVIWDQYNHLQDTNLAYRRH